MESTKSVSDLYAPVTAKVVAVNGDLEGNPQLVNSDPYGQGWLVELQADGDTLEQGLAALLDADAYRGTLTEMTVVRVPCQIQPIRRWWAH